MLKSQLPKLKYSYEGLEPVISSKLLEIHHSKHHQTYVNNLNKSVEGLIVASEKNNVDEISQLSQAIKFNGGGHFNHSFFWDNLADPRAEGGQLPDYLKVKQLIIK